MVHQSLLYGTWIFPDDIQYQSLLYDSLIVAVWYNQTSSKDDILLDDYKNSVLLRKSTVKDSFFLYFRLRSIRKITKSESGLWHLDNTKFVVVMDIQTILFCLFISKTFFRSKCIRIPQHFIFSENSFSVSFLELHYY